MKILTNESIYRHHDVQCSGPQLVLLLCDGAIRYLTEAVDHLKNERWVEKGNAVESAHECLTELQKTLNFDQQDEFTRNMHQSYDLLATKLSLANTERDVSQFGQITESIRVIRESWSELFKRLHTEGKLQDRDIKPKPVPA